MCLFACISGLFPLQAATYYVDFAGGNDSQSGTSPDGAWKHCPGDAQAKGSAASRTLQPGDQVIFKGGVVYQGSIVAKFSGKAGEPVIYDGNSAGTFGKGMAVISGGEAVTGWKPCTSADDAGGSPHFAKLLKASLPGKADWTDLNLVQAGERLLSVAQDPNMPDPFFQEASDFFHDPKQPVREEQTVKIIPLDMTENKTRAFVYMVDGGKMSAAINRLNGGGLRVVWPEETTFTRFGIAPQPGYTWPKDMALLANGKEILKFTLKGSDGGKAAVEQKFDLPQPVTSKELEIRFLGAQSNDGKPQTWGAVKSLAVYDSDGKNRLATKRTAFLKDDAILNQKDPGAWDGAVVSLHIRPNAVIYQDVLSFDPAKHELAITPFNGDQYPSTRYSILNSTRVLDKPGEYVVRQNPDGTTTVFVWPVEGLPADFDRSTLAAGLKIQQAAHVTVRNIRFQQFAGEKDGTALDASGDLKNPTPGLVIQGVEVRFNRSLSNGAIHANAYKDVLIEDCLAADNAGHMKGILVRNSENVLVRRCRVVHGSGTALDFYTVNHGAVLDNEIVDNKGMHANGLTFYVGCRNILVEGNRVRGGNVALTFQDGQDMIIRNNILEGGGTFGIGVWAGKPFNNVLIANNIILSHSDKDPALFGGNEGTVNLHVANNIIGGLGGTVLTRASFENNLILAEGTAIDPKLLPPGNRLVTDPKAVFRNPPGDLQPVAGGPTTGQGRETPLAGTHDLRGAPRLNGKDIGPFSSSTAAPDKNRPWPAFGWGDFKFPGVQAAAVAAGHFKHRGETPEITLPALDYTGQGGGELLRREEQKYFAKWDAQDQWVEWTVTAPEAGDYELGISLASALASKRSFFLNNEPVEGLQNVDMKISGAWKTFVDQYLPVPFRLVAGKNTLRIVNPDASALNFRELRFYRIVGEAKPPGAAMESAPPE